MAAVRAGAVGISRSPRFTIFSSRGSDWSTPREATTTRKGRGYGISVTTAEMAQTRFKQRRKFMDLKMKLCDWTLFFAMSGLLLAIIDVEMTASQMPYRLISFSISHSGISFGLRVICIFLTVLLLLTLIAYHLVDTKIYLIETGNDHWRIGMTRERLMKLLLELLVCSICPFPDTGVVDWPLLGIEAAKSRERVYIPTNVLVVIPMFLRLYIICRFILMHSRQYQDCATRTIASLNHVGVDFRFVFKSQLYKRPLYVLGLGTLFFWTVVTWTLTQCERYTFPAISSIQHFFDYLWFVIITFFSIGYGDIQVQTFCGRGLAMLTAIVGTLFSSTLIALVGRRLALSSSEKRVNHLIAENQLTRDHKHAAARVLQNTWRSILLKRALEAHRSTQGALRLASAQRGLLRAVTLFRKTRWRLRMQLEEEDDYFTARRAFLETEDRLSKVRLRQNQLDSKLAQLFKNVELLTKIVNPQVTVNRSDSSLTVDTLKVNCSHRFST
ncbi:unnamed protein product [Auanema sp. JU1783]|nr:unnamed protein product [Auanema sp. JU1783]